jgi:hypothetical protein
VALVDDCDHTELSRFKWSAVKIGHTYYAQRHIHGANGKRTTIYLHRVILGLTGSKVLCDHINGEGLDNRRSNLRIASRAQNNVNKRPQEGGTSKWKGVCFDKGNGKWRTQIGIDGKTTHLGYFHEELAAAAAYDRAAIKFFGEFAKTNFVPSPRILSLEVVTQPDGALQVGLKITEELAA